MTVKPKKQDFSKRSFFAFLAPFLKLKIYKSKTHTKNLRKPKLSVLKALKTISVGYNIFKPNLLKTHVAKSSSSIGKLILFSGVCIFSLTGCLFGEQSWEGTLSYISLPSVGSNKERANSDYFYLDLDVNYYKTSDFVTPLYEMSTSEEYGDSEDRDSVSNCEIYHDPDNKDYDTFTEDIMCIMDIMEQDFFVGNTSLEGGGEQEGRDLVLKYNVPEGMCAQLTITPPWHYNQRIGLGPRFLYSCEEQLPEGAEREARSQVCWSDNPGDINAYCPGGEYSSSTTPSSTVRCVLADDEEESTKLACGEFDLTDVDLGNCCFGEYYDEGGSKNDYEGDFQTCIGGVARHSWELVGDYIIFGNRYTNVPVTAILQIPREGLSDTINIQGILSVTDAKTSIPITNYIEDLDVDSEDLKDVGRDDLDTIFKSQEMRDGSRSPRPNPLWTFSCLDPAGEVVHQMHLMIREWNTHEEFIDFYDSQGEDDADPDVSGVEGDDCAYEDRELFGEPAPCNDFYDLEDFFDLDRKDEEFYTEFETGTQPNTNNRNRVFYQGIGKPFPLILYKDGSGSSGSSSDE